MIKLAAFLAVVAVSSSSIAAPVTSWSAATGVGYTASQDFDSVGILSIDTVATNQFAGMSFTGSVRVNGCGYNALVGVVNIANNYLGSFGPSCVANQVADNFSMKFAGDLGRLELAAVVYDYGQSLRVELYDDGALVGASTPITSAYSGLADGAIGTCVGGGQCANDFSTKQGYLTLDGAGTKFDEVRFFEPTPSSGQFIYFDNLKFVGAGSVPEPGSLALVGIALLGALRASRRGA